jgi:DUF4097 and DUF4098 domain-containing protein YvlB
VGGIYTRVTYGETELRDITGDIVLISASGRSVLENTKGMLDCSISAGNLEISASYLKAGSSLYASHGDIRAAISHMDSEGSWRILAATGDISLILPTDAGFSLKAGTKNGRFFSDFLKSGTAEVNRNRSGFSGRVGNGGPDIDIYTDKGDIHIN